MASHVLTQPSKYWNKLRVKKSGWRQSVVPCLIYYQVAYIICARKKKKKGTSIMENKSWKRDGWGQGGTMTLPVF